MDDTGDTFIQAELPSTDGHVCSACCMAASVTCCTVCLIVLNLSPFSKQLSPTRILVIWTDLTGHAAKLCFGFPFNGKIKTCGKEGARSRHFIWRDGRMTFQWHLLNVEFAEPLSWSYCYANATNTKYKSRIDKLSTFQVLPQKNKKKALSLRNLDSWKRPRVEVWSVC